MHYTTVNGLSGILSSGCIWATDATRLNDASEIAHFFNVRVAQVIGPEVRRRLYELAVNADSYIKVLQFGGLEQVISLETINQAKVIRDVTLGFNRPFVTSFCGPLNERVYNHGLLSQWRGYGLDGGCAVVFDTAAIESALAIEANAYAYTHAVLGDVYYEGIDEASQPAKKDFDEYERIVREGVARLYRGGRTEDTPRFYEAVTNLSCLCKHWGFWEEREVRLVVVVPQPGKEGAENPLAQPKLVKTLSRTEAPTQYVELFAGQLSLSEILCVRHTIMAEKEKVCQARRRRRPMPHGRNCLPSLRS